jgi:hypothetical protein
MDFVKDINLTSSEMARTSVELKSEPSLTTKRLVRFSQASEKALSKPAIALHPKFTSQHLNRY